jgi:hypothetical protein
VAPPWPASWSCWVDTAWRATSHYLPEWEADWLDLKRVYQYLAKGRWFRLVKNDSCVALGRTDYYIGKPLRGQTMEITFDAQQCVFLANVIGTTKTIALPPQADGRARRNG